MNSMTPNKPYLIRAIHEWICDNDLTTYLQVDASYPGVEIPRSLVQDNRIILNIAPQAVQGFVADNDWVYFSARFSGRPMNVSIPVAAILAIYAKENGQGMAFEPEPPPEPPAPNDDEGDGVSANSAGKAKSRLRVVK